MKLSLLILSFLLVAAMSRGERINQEGRILGPEPIVNQPILFNSAEADAVLSAMQVMPVDSAWNEDISSRPLLTNSAAMIAQIRADLASNRRTLRAFHEMNFVLVPDNQPLVTITFVDYPDESDPSPYPIPSNMPVETWPRETGSLTLAQWQQDVNNTGGDRHAIVVMPAAGAIWETWQAQLVSGRWRASNGAKFSLRSNTVRPAGWTSGDAAGLPMFPALVRYDECLRGMVEHAMRIVVRRSRREYIYPATHYASSTPASEVNVPAMGQRVRLKAGFVVPDGWSVFEKAVCRGLKKYGALVADNGNFFSISVTPDDRYPSDAFDHLSGIDVDNFEVVQTFAANEGSRSPGAPTVNAGPDFAAIANTMVTLGGSALGTAISVQWTKYSGPGSVTFGDPAQAATTAIFSEPGSYTLMLSARDGLHGPAYDALVVTVGAQGLKPSLSIGPASAATLPGGSMTLLATAVGLSPLSFQWARNGASIAGATGSAFTLDNAQPGDAGLYTAVVTGAGGTVASEPVIVALASTAKIIGAGSEIGTDIVHPSGRVYDQVLLQGAAVTATADSGQVLRISFVDLSDDIVQVEFSGAGALSLSLQSPSGPAPPKNYNQAVNYMKGHASILVTGANETTHLSVFSVGRANAIDQTLFRAGVTYDGVADIAFVAITSASGRFGSLRTGNASYLATAGVAGIYAPGVNFTGPVYVGDINASDLATPVMKFGSCSDAQITGGDLRQDNGRVVQVSGLTQLRFVDGTTSQGTLRPAQRNQARFEQDGVDVTSQIAVNPAP